MPGSPAWSDILPGLEGGVIPGRRHDAAGQASAGRHPALTVPGPRSEPTLFSGPDPVRSVTSVCDARRRAWHGPWHGTPGIPVS
jgi:hypothetical protein